MAKDKIRIAVWNLRGATTGEKSEFIADKINGFQRKYIGENKKDRIDIVLYLESLEGTEKRLPGIDVSSWEEGIKIPFENETKSSVWVPGRKSQRNYPKGILLVNYNKELEIHLFCDEDGTITWQGPFAAEVANCRTAIGFSVRLKCEPNKELLRVLGIWATPEPDAATGKVSTTQESYFTVLSNILHYYKANRFFASTVPCIVLGDTNVNLSSGADSQSCIKTENCKIRLYDQEKQDTAGCIRKLADECGLSEPLDLSCDPNYSSPPLNTLEHCGLWFRCDLMMISKSAIENAANGEKKLKSAFLGDFDTTKSDHCPIIFEVSVPD